MINRGCKICGGVPYTPTQAKKNKAWTRCASNTCPIGGVWMTVKQWEAPPKVWTNTEEDLYDVIADIVAQSDVETFMSQSGNRNFNREVNTMEWFWYDWFFLAGAVTMLGVIGFFVWGLWGYGHVLEEMEKNSWDD